MREKLRSIWHRIRKIKTLAPFTRLLVRTGVIGMVASIIDKATNLNAERQEFFNQNETRIKRISENLADEKSRLVYQNIIKFRYTHDSKYLEGIVDPASEEYFDEDIVKFGGHEVFVDCGAYIGDTVKAFLTNLRARGGKFEEIIAFEPDKKNFEKLKNSFTEPSYEHGGGYSRIRCYNLATWEKKGKMSFIENHRANSTISDYGAESTDVDSLDDILGDKKITFIKMDVEGAELPSLRGAERVITNNLPTLAICLYHRDTDMLDIPEYIIEKYPEYTLYVRHYSQMEIDTILYAIHEAEK